MKEGDVAKVGEGLCLIEVDEEAAEGAEVSDKPAESLSSGSPPSPATSTSEQPSISTSEAASQLQKRLHPLDPNYTPPSPSTPTPFAPRPEHARHGSQDVLAMPSVRHYARSTNVDLALLAPGSGRDGRIEKADVDAFLARSGSYAVAEASASQQQDVVVDLNRTRYNMWKAMEKVRQCSCNVLMCSSFTVVRRVSRYPTLAIPPRSMLRTSNKSSHPSTRAYPLGIYHPLLRRRNTSPLIHQHCTPHPTKMPFPSLTSSPSLHFSRFS